MDNEISALTLQYRACAVDVGGKVAIPFPGDPHALWGIKQRHDACGTVNGIPIRGPLCLILGAWVLPAGPVWWASLGVDPKGGTELDIILHPEGPLVEGQAIDIRLALEESPEAITFFYSIAPHYRKNWLRWVEEAKRIPTRNLRTAAMVAAFKSGQRDR